MGSTFNPEKIRKLQRHQTPIAWLVWAAGMAAVIFLISLYMSRREAPPAGEHGNPFEYRRTVTHHYRLAADQWMHSENMYFKDGQHGWLYLPQGAILFIPFHLFPFEAGEILYRLVIGVFYIWGLWRLAKFTHPEGKGDYFLWMTLLVIPIAAASIRNGQMNAPLAACLLHAMIDLTERRWWRAALLLSLAWMCKPIALVMILLVGVLYRPMMWRLPIGLAITLLLPFIHPDTSYVLGQYQAGFAKVIEAGSPGAGTFQDLRGLLYGFSIDLPAIVMTAIRGVAALAVLGLAWLGLRRYGNTRGSILLYSLAVAYLMVFNPRTEGNSYLIAAPALLAMAFLELWNQRKEWCITLLLFCGGLWGIHLLTGTPFPVPRPLIMLVFLMYLAVIILQKQDLPDPSETDERIADSI